jgi:hypothetical protein
MSISLFLFMAFNRGQDTQREVIKPQKALLDLVLHSVLIYFVRWSRIVYDLWMNV